jgi:hypothetical protein
MIRPALSWLKKYQALYFIATTMPDHGQGRQSTRRLAMMRLPPGWR